MFIAHDLGVVRHICDAVGVMYLGKIVEIGDADDVYEHPAHPYTQALLERGARAGSPQGAAARSGSCSRATCRVPANPPSGCRFRTRCWKAAGRMRRDRAGAGRPRAGASGRVPLRRGAGGDLMRRARRAFVVVALDGRARGVLRLGSPTPTRRGAAARSRVATVGLTTLDPAQADDPTEAAVAEMLFAPLVDLDPRTHEPRPGLAARWHVERRPDRVHVHAAPRARVLRRLADHRRRREGHVRPGRGEGHAVAHRAAARADRRVRGRARPGRRRRSSAASSRRVPARSRSRSASRSPRCPSVFAYPGLGIVDRRTIATIADAPVGSGPFRYAGRSGTTIELRRGRQRRRVAPASRGSTSSATRSLDDAQTAFDDDGVDLLAARARRRRPEGQAGEPARRRPTSRSASTRSTSRTRSSPTPGSARRSCRRSTLRASSTPAYPGGIVATGLVPDGVPGGGVDQCRTKCRLRHPRPRRSSSTQAFPGGAVPRVAVDYDDSPTQKTLADELVAQLTAVGIPADARPHPEADYANFLANGDPEVFRFGVVGDFPSEDTFLVAVVHQRGARERRPRRQPRGRRGDARGPQDGAPGPARAGVRRRRLPACSRRSRVAPVVQFETRLVTPQHGARRGRSTRSAGSIPRAVWKQTAVERLTLPAGQRGSAGRRAGRDDLHADGLTAHRAERDRATRRRSSIGEHEGRGRADLQVAPDHEVGAGPRRGEHGRNAGAHVVGRDDLPAADVGRRSWTGGRGRRASWSSSVPLVVVVGSARLRRRGGARSKASSSASPRRHRVAVGRVEHASCTSLPRRRQRRRCASSSWRGRRISSATVSLLHSVVDEGLQIEDSEWGADGSWWLLVVLVSSALSALAARARRRR